MAGVDAAERPDLVERADLRGRDAPELRDGGDAPVRGLAVGLQGQGLDLGEEDCIFGFCTTGAESGCLGCCERQEEEGQVAHCGFGVGGLALD